MAGEVYEKEWNKILLKGHTTNNFTTCLRIKVFIKLFKK